MLKVLVGLGVFVATAVLVIRFIEARSIFFPMKAVTSHPREIGLGYENARFTSSDNVSLHGWFIPKQGARSTVLFAHGNAGNIGHRLEKIRILHDLGVNVFIFDYRGYGESGGRPSEKGVYRDADAAYDYARARLKIEPQSLVIYGESLGGAVAIDLAARKPVGALIVEDTFTSVPAMVKIALPVIPRWALSLRLDSLSKIGRVQAPKLIIHSPDDEIVPYAMGEELYRAASPPKSFLKIRGGHNTAFIDSLENYRKGLQGFLNDLDREHP